MYLIPYKNQCVGNCDNFPYAFDNKCLNDCPDGMDRDSESKTCIYTHRWYKESEKKYVCTNSDTECPEKYPYIQQEKECVNTCDSINYNIFYNNECVSSCNENKDKVLIDENSPYNGIAQYICRCKNVWDAEGNCAEESAIDCKTLTNNFLLYEVKKTKEYVNKCPGYSSFYFNYECFQSCGEASSTYGYNVELKDANSKECICKNYFKINTDKNITECVDKCDEIK